MILIIGPLYAGKHRYVQETYRLTEEEWRGQVYADVQNLAKSPCDLEELADELSRYSFVLFTEMGSGIVPIDPQERLWREQAGRLSCLLAQRADRVVRIFCGLPTVLKGEN